MKRLILYILFMFVIRPLFSQINGIVYEQVNGEKSALPGVNIFWSGTNLGTVSKNDGSFEILKSEISDTLVFSFVGYNQKKMIIKQKKLYLEVVLSDSKVLDEVVIGERQEGSFYSKLETINVQNITGAELCKAACCNLSESFETNASVDATYSDAITGAKQIKLLGLAGKYVQILTENIPNFYGLSQPYALTYLPGPWMDAIQVSKGTSEVINGYEAISGQINVEYKKPLNENKLFFNQFVNLVGKAETNIDAGIPINNKLSTRLFAHMDRNFSKIDSNNDGFMDFPMVNQYNLFNRWDYFSKNWTLRTGIKYINEERKGGQVLHNFNGDFLESPYYGILINTERIEGFSKLGYVFSDNDYKSLALIINFISHKHDSYYGHRNYDARQYSGYINVLWQSILFNNEDHKYNAGITFKYEDLTQLLFDSLSNISYNGIEKIPGAYFQYTGKILEKFNLILGVRGDLHNEYGFLFTPRLHFKYNITGNIVWKASAGRGFRNANVYAENNFLFASARKIIIREDLNLEEAWNYGTSLTFYIPLKDEDITFQTEYYRTDFVNQIIVDFETPRQVEFYNLEGKSYSNTLQFELFFEPLEGLDFTAAMRFNDVKQTINNKLLDAPLTSKYKGLLNFSYKTPMERWQFDFTTQFNGPGRIPLRSFNDEGTTEFSAYEIFNAQITKYFKYWEIYFGCENISNFTQLNPIVSAATPFSDDFDSSLIWGPVHGRKFYVGVRFALK